MERGNDQSCDECVERWWNRSTAQSWKHHNGNCWRGYNWMESGVLAFLWGCLTVAPCSSGSSTSLTSFSTSFDLTYEEAWLRGAAAALLSGSRSHRPCGILLMNKLQLCILCKEWLFLLPPRRKWLKISWLLNYSYFRWQKIYIQNSNIKENIIY